MQVVNLEKEAKLIVSGLGLKLDLSRVKIAYNKPRQADAVGGVTRGTCNYDHRTDIITVAVSSGLRQRVTKRVLAHEIKHAEQYQTGKLKNCYGGLKVWEREVIDSTEVKYIDHPWEIEARVAEKDYTALLLNSKIERAVAAIATLINLF